MLLWLLFTYSIDFLLCSYFSTSLGSNSKVENNEANKPHSNCIFSTLGYDLVVHNWARNKLRWWMWLLQLYWLIMIEYYSAQIMNLLFGLSRGTYGLLLSWYFRIWHVIIIFFRSIEVRSYWITGVSIHWILHSFLGWACAAVLYLQIYLVRSWATRDYIACQSLSLDARCRGLPNWFTNIW